MTIPLPPGEPEPMAQPWNACYDQIVITAHPVSTNFTFGTNSLESR